SCWSFIFGKLTRSAITVAIMNRYGSGRISAMSRTITATVRPRLNENSFGRRLARFGSSAVFDRAEPEPESSPSALPVLPTGPEMPPAAAPPPATAVPFAPEPEAETAGPEAVAEDADL